MPYALDGNIDALTFQPAGSNQDLNYQESDRRNKAQTVTGPITWQASLAENYTDGVLILGSAIS